MRVNMRREQRRNAIVLYSISWQNRAGQMQSAEVQSVDFSNLGIRIHSAVELPAGTTVFIESKDCDARGYCTVKHCTRSADMYSVGLEFDEETRAQIPAAKAADVDYYEFLQISPRAEKATIQRIYRFMAARFHPDNRVTGDPEKFMILSQAYQTLSDPERRAEYDAKREVGETRANPIFEMSDFVNGIEGEMNRRLGVLSLLYQKRRTNSEDPKISLYDLEKRMGWPREYLDFTTWYLRSMQYITREDNSDFSLTVAGVNYIESNCPKVPLLERLLNSGSRTTTSAASSARNESAEIRETPLLAQTIDAGVGFGLTQ